MPLRTWTNPWNSELKYFISSTYRIWCGVKMLRAASFIRSYGQVKIRTNYDVDNFVVVSVGFVLKETLIYYKFYYSAFWSFYYEDIEPLLLANEIKLCFDVWDDTSAEAPAPAAVWEESCSPVNLFAPLILRIFTSLYCEPLLLVAPKQPITANLTGCYKYRPEYNFMLQWT